MSTPWQQLRPYRNHNPGDLRTLPAGQKWYGQTAVDTGPGGPFAVFGTEVDGWGALSTCLLAYQDLHGLHTVASMIGRFAPALENDTGGYVSLVCNQIKVSPNDAINAHGYQPMLALCTAISLAEGGSAIQWSATARSAGITASLARGVQGAHAVAPAAPMSVQHAFAQPTAMR